MRLLNLDIDKNTYKKQTRVTFMSFLAELPNLLLEFVNAFFSNSIFVWADFMGSFQATLHCFIVFMSTRRIERETGENYNFGVERLEDLISLICNSLVEIGYIIIIVTSIIQIFNPIAPTSAIVYFLILKVINILFDIYFYVEKLKIEKKVSNRLNQAEVANAFENLACDIAVFIIACVCCFFRGKMWSWYISPVASIIISSIFLVNCTKRIMVAFSELSDKSFAIRDQDKVFDIVLNHTDLIKKIINVNCRTMNNKKIIDLNVIFKNDVTYEEQKKLLFDLNKEIQKIIAGSTSRFVIEM